MNLSLGVAIVEAVQEMDGTVLITADHGNAEAIMNSDGSPITAHTLDPVPFIWISREAQEFGTSYPGTLREGSIPDIAPTILRLLDIPVPEEMTAPSIIPDEYFEKRHQISK